MFPDKPLPRNVKFDSKSKFQLWNIRFQSAMDGKADNIIDKLSDWYQIISVLLIYQNLYSIDTVVEVLQAIWSSFDGKRFSRGMAPYFW